METIQKLSFQAMPQELATKLQQLIAELSIEKIFFHPATVKDPGHLIIITTIKQSVEVIYARKWLRNVFKEHRVLLHVLYSQQLRFIYKNGNPFVPSYCVASAKVYQNPNYKYRVSTSWMDFKKRYKYYEHEYFRHHDVLKTLANEFHGLDARTSVFITYLSILEHHISFLENLFIGHSLYYKNLTERIKYLAQFLPEIEGLFVKQNAETYYLLEQLEKARAGEGQVDEINIHYELYNALTEVEQHLYKLVSERFQELKKRIKVYSKTNHSTVTTSTLSTVETHVSMLVSQIIKIKQVEEIYLFHKIQTATNTCYYLMLIGDGLSTELLNRMQQSVVDRFQGAYSVLILGHSRMWIQKELFIHQLFFRNIMTDENKVYQAPNKHYTLHWEKPYTPNYPDLDYLYNAANAMSSQYFLLRQNLEEGNVEGLNVLFSNAVLRIFRTYVFAGTSYLPNYLSAYNLWMLCLYAQPNIKKLEYLFEKLSGDSFFKEVDYNSRFQHRLSRLTGEKLLVMDEILNVLTLELRTECQPGVVGGMDENDLGR